MMLGELLKHGESTLVEAGIEDWKTDAWYLLQYICRMDRSAYFLHQRDEVDEKICMQYEQVLARRAEHVPLQHITGTQDFMGLSFFVNEHVLIPRQDTEVLVETCMGFLREGDRVLDMCTGSGCIIISLVTLCHDIIGTGVDISLEALQVARKNARDLGTDITFVQSNLFEDMPEQSKYDMIVSNPPYIRTEVIGTLMEEVRCHEPVLALDGTEDGLFFYREIIKQACSYLQHGGRLCFEIGHDQAEDVKALMEKAGYEKIEVKKDLAGLDRVVTGCYMEGKRCLTN